ncbi:hypothetical protein INS49_004993 [Diaporthe citri]|uniref:uncharacterized protein n=1 Tax=Diaporthe citri TaxID=83186 RepID=UPI001C7EFD54|nr:uncharacterized protein INS49_004993 [Diaporthe citri]KAG6354022.1 hypothetical protein INS49_004993 [Diaporthe citri]
MDAIGSNLGRIRDQYSQQCLSAFLNLLRRDHGEKRVQANRFYQTYIADPHHAHLKDTRWGSLTRFAEWLGREGKRNARRRPTGDERSASWRSRSTGRMRMRGIKVLLDLRKLRHSAPHKDADATVAFRFGPNATASASHTFQPEKAPNIFKAAVQKRKRPVEESAESGRQGFPLKQPL